MANPVSSQPRQAPILEHAPAGLLLRAVRHHVVLEVHRLEHGPAARAWLALTAVHLERHRHLVRDLVADDLLVVIDGVAEDMQADVDSLDLLAPEVRALLEG